MRKAEDNRHQPVIIPDTRGSALVGFWGDDANRFPVLAWRIDPDTHQATPVLCQALPEVWCVELTVVGVTQWIFPNDRTFGRFHEAHAYARSKFAPRSNPDLVAALAKLPTAIAAALEHGTGRKRRAPLHVGHKSHQHCGRVCMPGTLFDEFVRRRNHDNAEIEIRDWALEVELTWADFDGEPGNPFEFWRARYRERWPTSSRARTSAAAKESNREH